MSLDCITQSLSQTFGTLDLRVNSKNPFYFQILSGTWTIDHLAIYIANQVKKQQTLTQHITVVLKL